MYNRRKAVMDLYAHETKVSLLAGAVTGAIVSAVMAVIIGPRVGEFSIATSELIGAALSIVLLFSALAFAASLAVTRRMREIELSYARSGIDRKVTVLTCLSEVLRRNDRHL